MPRRRPGATPPIPLPLATQARRRQGVPEGVVPREHRQPVPQHGQNAPLAVPQLGSCASSGHSWRLWAVRNSQREAGPLGAQPLPWVLEPAASQAAYFPAFDHPGAPLPEESGPLLPQATAAQPDRARAAQGLPPLPGRVGPALHRARHLPAHLRAGGRTLYVRCARPLLTQPARRKVLRLWFTVWLRYKWCFY